MTGADLDAVSALYACSSQSEYERHRVSHEAFRRFCRSVDHLRRAVREADPEGEDEDLTAWLRPLVRYRWAMCAAPLPLFHAGVTGEGAAPSALRGRLEHVRASYAMLAEPGTLALEQYIHVTSLQESPQLDAICDALSGYDPPRTALLVRDAWLLEAVEAALAVRPATRRIQVVTPASLRHTGSYDRLFITGVSAWFPDFVLTAPRARKIDLVHYSWLHDRQARQRVFEGSIRTVSVRPRSLVELERSAGGDPGSEGDLEALLPGMNWREATAAATRRVRGESTADDVDARLVLLAGGRAVFLEPQGSVTAIDATGASADADVRRLPLGDVEQGMAVLLRTEGGGDYIVPVADRVMGPRAAQLREAQRAWKARLRHTVRQSTYSHVSRRLAELGAVNASEQNIRNWISERSIRPQEYGDFRAIFQLVGAGERDASDVWKQMGLVDSAHRKAGMWIRRLLMREMRRTDLGVLDREGILEVALPDASAGKLAAFRVERISPGVVPVPAGRLGHPFQLEGD